MELVQMQQIDVFVAFDVVTRFIVFHYHSINLRTTLRSLVCTKMEIQNCGCYIVGGGNQ